MLMPNVSMKRSSAMSSSKMDPIKMDVGIPNPSLKMPIKNVNKKNLPLASLGNMPEFKMQKSDNVSELAPGGSVVVPLYKDKATPIEKSIGAPPVLSYGNGPLLTNVQVTTIFWGNAWTQAPQNTLLTQLNQFFDFVLTSPLIDMLGEYNVSGKNIGHGSRIGTYTETASQPGGNTNQLTDAQLQQQIQTWINNGNVTSPGANTLYFVYLPPNVTLTGPANSGTSCQDFCGYHWFIQGTNPEIYYAAMPFPGCNGCLGGLSQIDSLTSVSSHELCESITDPQPWTGWNSSSGEIGDICAWQTGVIGGFTVQKEWSNKAGACIIQNNNVVDPWSGWYSLGGWIDRLAIDQNQDGRLEIFARGGDGAVYHNWQTTPNGNWSGWASLGGWIDMLTVGNNQDGRLEIFARGGDGAVYHNWQTIPNGNWSGWASLGGWIDMLTVGRNQDGRLEIFARGGDGAVYHNWQTTPNGNWSGWASLGGWIDMLTVGQNQDGRLEIFARGGDGAVYHNWQTAPNY